MVQTSRAAAPVFGEIMMLCGVPAASTGREGWMIWSQSPSCRSWKLSSPSGPTSTKNRSTDRALCDHGVGASSLSQARALWSRYPDQLPTAPMTGRFASFCCSSVSASVRSFSQEIFFSSSLLLRLMRKTSPALPPRDQVKPLDKAMSWGPTPRPPSAPGASEQITWPQSSLRTIWNSPPSLKSFASRLHASPSRAIFSRAQPPQLEAT
mmetsp:Transcript_69035/g.202085  ORF Transcript_69035/g.202085 Transcript_69035/m.202085 type:complete len:209 (+) Transcript_69035:301-927(+)